MVAKLKLEMSVISYFRLRVATDRQGIPIYPEARRNVYGYAYIVRGWQFIPKLRHAAGRKSNMIREKASC
jgi:hypothetical protein